MTAVLAAAGSVVEAFSTVAVAVVFLAVVVVGTVVVALVVLAVEEGVGVVVASAGSVDFAVEDGGKAGDGIRDS